MFFDFFFLINLREQVISLLLTAMPIDEKERTKNFFFWLGNKGENAKFNFEGSIHDKFTLGLPTTEIFVAIV